MLVDCLSDLISFGRTLSCCIRCQLFMLAFIASGVNRTSLLTAGQQKCDETLREPTFRVLWGQICFLFHISNCIPYSLYPKYQIQDQILQLLHMIHGALVTPNKRSFLS